jgi:hypothetical protein
MKAIKGDLLNLWIVLENLKPKQPNARFSYFMAKNKMAIKNEVDALNLAQEPSELFKEYDVKRAEIAQKYADKDANGVAMTKNNQYVIVENKKKFDTELTKLKKKYQKAIDEREEQARSFGKLLAEEVEFDGYQIALEFLPDDIDHVVMEIFLNTNLIKEDMME